jgi:hypothetical protein
MPRLENWYIIGRSLIGQVYNDERFADGTEIQTSRIIKLDSEAGIAQTRNTTYELGKYAYERISLQKKD